MAQSLIDRGAYYAGLGYQPVPIARGRKACYVPGWQTQPWDQVYKYAAAGGYAGHGVLARTTAGVDLDIYDEAMVGRMRDWCLKNLGTVPQRQGLPPKLLLPYRVDEPFAKIISASYRAPGAEKPSRIEVLGDGQQWVAEAIHPDTHQPYRWSAPLPPRSELPVITASQANDLCDVFEAVAEGMGWQKVGEREAGKSHEARPDPILDALTGQGLVKRQKGSEPGTWHIRCPWTDEHTGAKDDGAAYLQAHFAGREHDGFRCHHASCQGRSLRDLQEFLGLEDPLGVFDDAPEADTDAYRFSSLIRDVRAPYLLVEDILRRGDMVGVLAHPGGGKTAVTVAVALAVASGVMVGGKRISRQRVLYIGAENPDEVKLRLKMWCAVNDMAPEELDGWFHFVGKPVKAGDTATLKSLVKRFSADRYGGAPLGLVVIDTFAANFFGEDENSAAEVMAWLNTVRVEVILATGAAVMILHHPPKGAVEWEELHNWRGAGSAKATLDATWALRVEGESVIVNNDRGKARMQPFADLTWHLRRVEVEGMANNFGSPVTTVVASLSTGNGAEATIPWLTAAILHCIHEDKHTNPQRIAGHLGRHRETIHRAMTRLKKNPRLIGERGDTLYLTNAGRGVLEQAIAEGWKPVDFEVVEEWPSA